MDGDTIVVLAEGNVQHKIRLQVIDAPERGQAYGIKSKEHRSELVAGQFVTVAHEKRDQYGATGHGFYPDFTDTSRKAIMAREVCHGKAKKVLC